MFKKNQHLILMHLRQLICIMLLSGLSIPLMAQQEGHQVRGKVWNERGEPIPGVTVTLQGSTGSVIANEQGEYRITAPRDGQLVFTYVGFDPQTVAIDGRSEINVTMIGGEELEEVLVIGYGTQTREKLTTAVSRLDSRVLENVPFTNASAALQGQIPGLRVQTTSGQPGAASRIILRGGTSIGSPNGSAPLYIVDGVIRGQGLNDINADDIETMQVLKDAAATAIYGARGSNGVIIVTTKSGKPGRTNISYGYDLAAANATRLMEYASARDYIHHGRIGVAWAALKNPSIGARNNMAGGHGIGNDLTSNTAYTTMYLTDDNKHKLDEGWESMPDPLDPSKTIIFKETIYQDLIYQTGHTHNHNVNVSGGTDRATFNAGVGYILGEGTAIETDYKRLSLNMNSTLKVYDNLDVTGRMLYSTRSWSQVPSIANTFYRAASLPGTAKYMFEDGALAPGQNRSIGNPHYHLRGPHAPQGANSVNGLTMGLSGKWQIMEGLVFEPIVSLVSNSSDAYSFNPTYLNGVGALVDSRTASSGYSKTTQWQADAVMTYTKTFGFGHNLEAKAGFAHFSRNNLGISAAGRDAATDLIPTLNAAPTPTSVGGSITDLVIQGGFSRINYDYQSKYMVSLNARYDGASNLGADHRFGFFPGISVGWNLHKEDFWGVFPENLIDFKLRGSYGVNGNISGLGDFTAQGLYSVTTRYDGLSAIMTSTIPNSNLMWEQSKTLDVGFDLGLFGRRITAIFDYYDRKTENLLTNANLPPSSGHSSILTNLGTLQNRGVEVELSARVLPAASAVQWDLGVNAGYTIPKILKLPDNGIENNRIGGFNVWDPATGDYAWLGGAQEGGRLGDMYGYQFQGVFATDEEAWSRGVLDEVVGGTNKTQYGGDAYFADIDGNGVINSFDRVYLGNPYPTWTGGVNNYLSYKGFSFAVRLDYMLGHTVYNYAKYFADAQLQGDALPTKDYFDKMWKQPGDITDQPRYIWQNQQSNLRPSSQFHQRGDFLALREMTLGYNLPEAWVKRIGLSNTRLNLTGNNLHYFTKYVGPVPEEGGRDNGHYPIPRTFSLGLRVGF